VYIYFKENCCGEIREMLPHIHGYSKIISISTNVPHPGNVLLSNIFNHKNKILLQNKIPNQNCSQWIVTTIIVVVVITHTHTHTHSTFFNFKKDSIKVHVKMDDNELA
jgi:sarcosine oxidase delta subunit